jgi:serine phosphatase RsbU (regulator of sigma subunit)
MQTIVYGMLFVVISRSNRKQIVENIRRVNDSLEDITAGKLDTKVEVNATTEFEQLSEGVNTTVDSLKRYIAEANARIDTELEYAREIQTSALPSHFPAFPNRNEIDIYALMKPAKEVGGDFYDFYFIDEKHLAFAIADVSGKGIPAALFMMRSKTLLKTYATYGIAVADIFTNGNFQLGEENDADMFVTAWMGILNLETGELKYANAGHNRPLLRRKDGTFEYLKGPAGMVLAGVKNMVYKEQTLMLEPGDELFLYTDGVVEAKNADGEMYGDDRLNQSINRLIGKSAEETCKRIRQDVEEFYEGAPQFDDMTELMIRFRQYWNQN